MREGNISRMSEELVKIKLKKGTKKMRSDKDQAFITTMGIDTSTFHIILEASFRHLWYTQPIPRPDTQTTIHPQPTKRSLDAAGGLGLVLHWLSSMMQQVSLQQIFALMPSTVSRYLSFALSILLEVLSTGGKGSINWGIHADYIVVF